jgi:hypothetical protein
MTKVEEGNIFHWFEKKKKKLTEEKMFTHFKKRMVGRGKIKCPPCKSCVELILNDCKCQFSQNINEFDVWNKFIKYKIFKHKHL